MPTSRMFPRPRILAGLIAAAAVSGCSWLRADRQPAPPAAPPQDGYAVSRPLPCNDYPVSYKTYAAGTEGRIQPSRPQPLSPEQRSAAAQSIADSCARR